eukprot:TRINITY_DN63675_c0_g1_i1.p2 TRINITY_DN63675_c0_g1~~TRINITY_DN63675_c0_g1_i1.p2  ORF type:complete len:100 (-),score=16.18 TRINITY_DN63675_c0_g1_i1:101-367(-)
MDQNEAPDKRPLLSSDFEEALSGYFSEDRNICIDGLGSVDAYGDSSRAQVGKSEDPSEDLSQVSTFRIGCPWEGCDPRLEKTCDLHMM